MNDFLLLLKKVFNMTSKFSYYRNFIYIFVMQKHHIMSLQILFFDRAAHKERVKTGSGVPEQSDFFRASSSFLMRGFYF